MATSTRSHSKKMSLQNSSIEEPSVGGGGTKRKSCKIDFNVMDMSVDNNNSMAKKKTKLYHPINNTVDTYSKNNSMATVAIKDRRTLSSTSLTSPTDVRRASDSLEENVGPMPSSNNNCSGQIKMLPPTLKGITDAAMVLHASKSSSTSTDKDTTTTLVSFPTESVYMLACCVKSASSRSVRKLISRTDDSQTSFSSSSSSSKSDEVIIVSEASSIQEHQGGISITSSLKDIIHPSNSSLDWIVKCSSGSDGELTNTTSSNPLLFVLDAQHALSYCHFTKPRSFAIRPPTVAKSSSATSSSVPPPTAPSTPIVKNSSTTRNSFSPLPVFQTPSTPKLSSTTTTGGLKCPPSTPITPGNTTNTQKRLCAANFSESREVFLRLSSKFWPGPVIFNVQVRALGGEDNNFENEKLMSTSTSMASLPSLLSSTGDLVAAGKTSPTPISAAALPILPESALIPAANLLGGGGQDDDRYFVSMRCPSHPLSQKILKEIYQPTSFSRLNTSSPTVAPSQSTESLVSISSMDDSGSKSNSRPRSRSIAVVGCEVPTGSSISSSATTAADVDKAMSIKKKDGSVFIVNGEDNREIFSVPTCQYGKSHPISLVIDGDNKTIYLIRHAKDEASPVTKDSVYRALIKPDTNNKEKKGDTSSIDRVISAVLSRWKIVESS